jgi:hypothetical protein
MTLFQFKFMKGELEAMFKEPVVAEIRSYTACAWTTGISQNPSFRIAALPNTTQK